MIFLPFLHAKDNLGNVVESLKFSNPRVLPGNGTTSPQSDSPGPPRLALYLGGFSKYLGGGGCQREGFLGLAELGLESGGPQEAINPRTGHEGGATGRTVTLGQWSVPGDAMLG